MTQNKRFKHSITLQGEDEIWDSQDDVYFKVCGALEKLNHLHELADGNEEQLLAVMTYLHDNYYEIWEEVNKECYDD